MLGIVSGANPGSTSANTHASILQITKTGHDQQLQVLNAHSVRAQVTIQLNVPPFWGWHRSPPGSLAGTQAQSPPSPYIHVPEPISSLMRPRHLARQGPSRQCVVCLETSKEIFSWHICASVSLLNSSLPQEVGHSASAQIAPNCSLF